MTANAADFAGPLCGRRYEKELETHFRDCLLFYLDGRIRFERYCYGEAACLVFSAWAHGFGRDGELLWDKEPEFESQRTALPRVLTDVQENGTYIATVQYAGTASRALVGDVSYELIYAPSNPPAQAAAAQDIPLDILLLLLMASIVLFIFTCILMLLRQSGSTSARGNGPLKKEKPVPAAPAPQKKQKIYVPSGDIVVGGKGDDDESLV